MSHGFDFANAKSVNGDLKKMELAISEICEKFQSGKNILASNIFDDGMYPVFGGNGLRGYTNTFNQDGEYAIIGRQGVYCGNVKYHKGKAYLTEHAIIALPKSTHNALYLAYKLKFANLAQYQGQSAQPGLSVSTLSKFKLDMPDYSSQKKIADVLSCIDDKIALNNKTNTELENMAKTIYDYWFTQFDYPDKNGHPYKTSGGQMVYNETLKREIPAGWEGFKLEKCLSRIATGLNPRDNFVLGKGNMKYLTVKNLNTDGTIDFSNCDLIDEEALKLVHARSDIKIGDILFASIAPLGRCYLIQDTPKRWDINESVFSIRPNTDLISSIYLYMFFMDESFVKLAQLNSTGSIFKGIRINYLYSIPILVPEKQILEKFSETITPIMNMKYRVEKENKELIELRDYLLPLLMNGQIEVK